MSKVDLQRGGIAKAGVSGLAATNISWFYQQLQPLRSDIPWLQSDSTLSTSDDEIHEVVIQVNSLPLYHAAFTLAPYLMKLPEHHQQACFSRLAAMLTNSPADNGAHEFYGAVYEVYVYYCLCAAGYEPAFIPQGAVKTPDIVIEKEKILVECKDCIANTGNFEDAVRATHRNVDEAMDKATRYPGADNYTYVVFADLPEGTYEMLRDERLSLTSDRPGNRLQMLNALCGKVENEDPSGRPLVDWKYDNPQRLFFTDFPLTLHRVPNMGVNLQLPGVILPPPSSSTTPAGIAEFCTRFLRWFQSQ